MAENVKLQALIKELGRGTLVSAAKVRDAFKTAEVNVLTLTNAELTTLNKVLDKELQSGDPNSVAAAKNYKTLISQGTLSDTGDITLPKLKYSTLSSIGDKIGKTNTTGWQLGHNELGNAAQRLAFILEHYKVAGARHLNQEEKRLIESAMLGAQKLERLDEQTLLELAEIETKDADILVAALQGDTTGLSTDLEALNNFVVNANTGSITISYVFEDKNLNLSKGGLTRNLSNTVGKYLRNIASKEGEALAKRLDALWEEVLNPYGVSNSPSAIDLIEQTYDAAFHGRKQKKVNGKGKKVRYKRRTTINRASAKRLQSQLKKQTKNLQAKIRAVQSKKAFIIPTITLKSILNRFLAEYIRNRMESSASPQSINYLRNQTGRFSESAVILTLNRAETGAYTGIYTYMKEPYQTFEEGGELGSPGRDPRLYIEGAARDMAMQVLKQQFKGIALELK